MKRIDAVLLRRMAATLSREDRDEMAIPSYLHPNPALRAMAWARVGTLAAMLARCCEAQRARGPLTVLDFGCGTGVLLGECSRHAARVYGVDPVLAAAELLVDAWKLDRVRLLRPEQMDAQIEAGSVQVVVAGEVLEHVEPLEPTLAAFQRVLAPGGTLLASLPTENVLYRLGRRLAGFEGHYHHSNAASIHARVLAAGYRLRTRRALPLPGPFAIYWLLEYQRPD